MVEVRFLQNARNQCEAVTWRKKDFEMALRGARLGEGKTPIENHLKRFVFDEIENVRQLTEVEVAQI